MGDITPAAVLRQLQQAQAGLKKARQVLRLARSEDGAPRGVEAALKVGWESLAHTHRVLAQVPLEAVNDEVLTRQLAVQRYATALLVRLRRLLRRGEAGAGEEQDDEEQAWE